MPLESIVLFEKQEEEEKKILLKNAKGGGVTRTGRHTKGSNNFNESSLPLLALLIGVRRLLFGE